MRKRIVNEEEVPEETPKEDASFGIMGKEASPVSNGRVQPYFFPKYGKTVYATSLEEANKKIKEQNE